MDCNICLTVDLKHFNLPDHSVNDAQLNGIKHFRTQKRKIILTCESLWIAKLRTLTPKTVLMLTANLFSFLPIFSFLLHFALLGSLFIYTPFFTFTFCHLFHFFSLFSCLFTFHLFIFLCSHLFIFAFTFLSFLGFPVYQLMSTYPMYSITAS